MYKPSDPVSVVKKVGPKYTTLLKKLDISTVNDLLYHFPFRYDDFSKISLISELQDNMVVSVKAEVQSFNNIYSKSNKRLSKAVVTDFTGKLDIIWFNQHYLKNVIKKNTTYYFSGKVQKFGNKLSLISPSIEIEGENNVDTARVVPIYPETAGISSKYLRSKINDVLLNVENIKEFLPTEILEKENIQNINWSLRQIHFPDSTFEASIARDRFAFEELFIEMLKVESRRNLWDNTLKSKVFKPFNKEVNDFINNLPFTLTIEQQEAIEKVSYDFTQNKPMNRLLEGDVGTGKTIVAVVCSYMAYLNKQKTLYMAPTEILAKQHFQTFTQFLPNLNIVLLTGSNKSGDIENADIIIGTHAILFTKSKLTNIAFVVIDEQHRFGVAQRGKLLEMGEDDYTPHLLSMTATPIPRTLSLTMYGDLDISLLKVHPNKNRKVTTKVITQTQRDNLYKWIKNKNEQTFIVCPLIEESESAAFENVKAAEKEFEDLKKGVLKNTKIGLLHGRMKPKEKQEIIEKFKNKEIMILVSTPVIEVGIDVPDAAVIVIESAERYGLASLHQLRGRVGRGSKEGFCFVSMSNNSRNSFERLKNLEKVSNGLDLAEIDMKNRGSGDVFGTMQHGFKQFKVASIYDIELLEKAKEWAGNIFKDIDTYQGLKEKIQDNDFNYIKNN